MGVPEMNYFVEGLQGSGKSTLVNRLSERYPDCLLYQRCRIT